VIERLSAGVYTQVARKRLSLQGPPEAQPTAMTTPCALPPGDYRMVLIADRATIQSGFFPRQIGFGLASLTIAHQER